ncbi:hypothetical protein SAMN05421640_1761 [Ekhidna lutea]|uniref:Outer membrane lipoprotein-sorting protein n=1 Tax=Ekhidna lutea TaxID=447679 RepID=A0A239IQH5_EKHLU|nr:DUF6503 family protein [Ekhidna lutea]SNS95458.1 hypothetical protein SAMN05421640_1761 [Ekhidna lutea]
MRKLLLLLVCPLLLSAQTPADQILAKAKAYHDPQDIWPTLETTFTFKETRPDGPDRSTIIILDNGISYMKINRNDEEVYEVNGEVAEVLKGDKDKARALVLRNYYLYLWGLPMKLYDKSTPEISLAEDEKVGDKLCKVLRVVYEEDTWYFYIDDFSGRMLQYKFYKDEATGKGELITLEDEIMVDGIKIPQERSWYTLPEMKYLGTDILEEVD